MNKYQQTKIEMNYDIKCIDSEVKHSGYLIDGERQQLALIIPPTSLKKIGKDNFLVMKIDDFKKIAEESLQISDLFF